MADESFIVVHELTEDFDLEKELFEDEVDLMMLSAVSCFMRRDLNRIQDYFELTVPSYRETPLVCCVLICLFRVTRSNIRYVPSKCIRERSKCGNDGSIYQPWWLTTAVTKTSEESDAIFQNEGKLRGKAWKRSMHFIFWRSVPNGKRGVTLKVLYNLRTEFSDNYLTIWLQTEISGFSCQMVSTQVVFWGCHPTQSCATTQKQLRRRLTTRSLSVWFFSNSFAK